MPKILFVASHRPNRAPAQRFRFEQYLDFLKQHGFDYHFSYLISENDDKIFYTPGNLHNKLLIFLKSAIRRLKDAMKAGHYDIVFVQREAFMTGSTYFEKRFAKSRAKLVFDFDDAIWNHDVSEANRNFGWLKDPGKTSKIIGLADLVIAGNQYLADYASRFNRKVMIIPTTIDTNEYQPVSHTNGSKKIVIGWSGSITTIRHFEMAIPFLRKLREKFGDLLEFKVIGYGNYRNEELNIVGIPWRKEDELKELGTFDIGIMPIPDDDWSKGKCGLKGLQYMALGIATVMSPVGVNSVIINDGVNGYLASDVDEWVDKLSKLISDSTLRASLGTEARKTIEESYSVKSWQQVYLDVFKQLVNQEK